MNDKTKTDTDLLPCPFCGETPTTTKHFRDDAWSMVHRCKAIGPVSFEWASQELIARRWNTRALLAGHEQQENGND